MKTVIEYDAVSGAIRRISTQSDKFADEILAAPETGEEAIDVTESDIVKNYEINELYVDTATAGLQACGVINPTVTTASGEVSFSNLPDPCTVIWEGQEGVITGGAGSVTFDEPGTKFLVLKAYPKYLRHQLEVVIP